jgi:predicted enzyme related to lactoylglutathione lyase
MRSGIGEIKYIIINSPDVKVSVNFWAAVLDREVVKKPTPYTDLIKSGAITVSIQEVPKDEFKPGANIHFDISNSDIDEAVKQIVKLGGILIKVHEYKEWRWAVCKDPLGIVFCVVQN